jgi:hypothetical protein
MNRGGQIFNEHVWSVSDERRQSRFSNLPGLPRQLQRVLRRPPSTQWRLRTPPGTFATTSPRRTSAADNVLLCWTGPGTRDGDSGKQWRLYNPPRPGVIGSRRRVAPRQDGRHHRGAPLRRHRRGHAGGVQTRGARPLVELRQRHGERSRRRVGHGHGHTEPVEVELPAVRAPHRVRRRPCRGRTTRSQEAGQAGASATSAEKACGKKPLSPGPAVTPKIRPVLASTATMASEYWRRAEIA